MKTASRSMLILTGLAGAGLAQTFHGEFYDPYCEHCMYRRPWENQYTVHVLDYPLKKKPVELKPEKNQTDPDPLKAHLNRRMEAIGKENFVSTNTIPINMAPGL